MGKTTNISNGDLFLIAILMDSAKKTANTAVKIKTNAKKAADEKKDEIPRETAIKIKTREKALNFARVFIFFFALMPRCNP